jgi:hypothetical protein
MGGGIFVWEKWLRGNFLHLLNRNETKDNQDYIEELKNEKKELDNKIVELNGKLHSLEKKKNELLDENIELGKRIERMQQSHKQQNDYPHQNAEKQTIINQPRIDNANTNDSMLYADSIIDGYFNRVKEAPDADTTFELHLQNSHIASFVVYGSAVQRIIANPSFLEGCEKQVLANARSVKTESKGETQRGADGKWKIIRKLSVTIS